MCFFETGCELPLKKVELEGIKRNILQNVNNPDA